MNTAARLLATTLLTFGLAAAPAAALVIDDFTAPASTSASSGGDQTAETFGGMLGSYRNSGSFWGAGPGTTSLVIGGGVAGFSQDAGTSGLATFGWDGGPGAPGLGGIDFTAGGHDAFSFDFLSMDGPMDIWIQVSSTDGGNSQLTLMVGTLAGPTTIDALFSSFVGTADFTDVNDIPTSGPDSAVFERLGSGHFRIVARALSVITQAQITAIQNVGPGYSWALVDKEARAFGSPGSLAAEFRVYDGAGSPADATIDATLKGPRSQ